MTMLLLLGIASVFVAQVQCQIIPEFYNGRHQRWGMTGPPPNVTNNIGDSWFTQKVDHYNTQDTRTWNQRYFVNAQYYRSGGPAFIMIGGEGEASASWMTGGQWVSPAQTHGAMLFQLEHRYYGKSFPTSDMSTPNLKYLSSQQALNDVATFQQAMMQQYNLQNAKWIVFGCSYSGNLAAWYRLYYPNLAHAAMAGSAPVQAEVNFYQYYEVITSSLEKIMSGCGTTIQQAIYDTYQYMQSDSGKQYLSTLFNTCAPVSSLQGYDIPTFWNGLANPFAGMVQYVDTDTKNYCNDIVNGQGTPIERLATVLKKSNKGNCFYVSYAGLVQYYKQTGNDATGSARQWVYQTCQEFGYYQSSDSKNQAFWGFPVDFYLRQCYDIFGSYWTPDQIQKNVDYSNSVYHGKSLNVERVVFPNGILDPWRSLGIQSDLNPNAPAITIDGSAHCAIYYPENWGNNPSLKTAQQKVDQLITQWLSED